MQPRRPAPTPWNGSGPFLIASASLVLVFAVSGAPIPLFSLYRAEDGVTDTQLGWVSVAYFLSAATALLVLGRLSNYLGRRPVAVCALVCAMLSCLILAVAKGAFSLSVARVLQGMACGIASTALGSYVVDTAPSRARWLPAAITGSSPMVGISLGALASGILAEYGPAPRSFVHLALAGLACLSMALLLASPETVASKRGVLASLRPRLEIPNDAGRRLTVAGAAFVATWSFGGFYQAFGASVTTDYLGTRSPLLVAIVFSSILVLNPFGSPLAGRLSTVSGIRGGLTVFSLAVLAIMFGFYLGAVEIVVSASLVVGLAQGVASTCAIRSLLLGVRQDERAGLLSTIYLISYAGAAIPALVAGPLARHVELMDIATGYAALALAASALSIVMVRSSAEGR
ncbi:MFS transporter [Aureimonas phyllosphaerae]|uniref:MFS transporter n=1 Tax=Aureimonas phyllosphaerae TaxID=1166078 RepID=UPI003A5C0927